MLWKPRNCAYILSVNMTKLKNIKGKHLRSQKKLATEKEKLHVMETLEMCIGLSVNMTKLKNIKESTCDQ